MTQRNIQADLDAHLAADSHSNVFGDFIHDIVYGGNDGIVTTFAVVAGATGADLPVGIIIILGLANLIADGTSMATGAFLSIKSEMDQYVRLRKEEAIEIQSDPELETAAVARFFAKKGFTGDALDSVVRVITSNKELWSDTMMIEEHKVTADSATRPLAHGLVTFASFVFFGAIPLIPYVFTTEPKHQFTTAVVSTVIALTLLGLTRSIVTKERIFRGPLEIILVGALGAIVAYGIGVLFKGATGVAL